MSEEIVESFSDRQNNEFEILKSIYGDDIADLRLKDAWKVPRPPEFMLLLQPQESMGQKKNEHVNITMKVKFLPTYPDCLPELKFENPNGLSTEAVNTLYKQTLELSETLLGEVMMLQIAQFVQEYLHKFNVPQFSSIHEEMVHNEQKLINENAKKEEKQRKLKQRKKEIMRQEIEEELARRKEEEKREKQNRKLLRDERDAATERSRNLSESSSHSADYAKKPTAAVEIKFPGKQPRSILVGQEFGKAFEGFTYHVGIDHSTGKVFTVQYMTIPCPERSALLTNTERTKLDKCLKAVNTIEQEINSLQKLSHCNIALYFAMKTQHSNSVIEIHILQEFIQGISLDQKLSNKERIELDTVRVYTQQMLLALQYLHQKSVVHKQFQANCVFLDNQGTIKISNYSIGKRLADLHKETQVEVHNVRFSEDRIPARLTKKGDVLRLGMVVLSLAKGQLVVDYPPDTQSGFPAVFLDFLDKCLVVEDRFRQSASELLEHAFIKTPLESSIAKFTEFHETVHNGDNADDLEYQKADDKLYPSHSSPESMSTPVQLSRLHSEFEELEWLGKGGYGDVIKVRNVLDDCHYAIKRIHLNPHRSQFNKKITREVKLLSRLNHENVVRYYNSWIESTQCNKDDISVSSSSNITDTDKVCEVSKNSLGISDNIENLAPPPAHSVGSEWSISMEEVSRAHQFEDEDDDDEEDMFKTIYVGKQDSSSESILFDHDEDSHSSNEDDISNNFLSTTDTNTASSSTGQIVLQKILYIQMEYCEKSTLRQTIDSGLCHETDRMWRLFREILEGLVHIHQQGMIHRDLKPQNIFLDKNDHVKIGDFGLATAHSRGQLNDTMEESSSKSDVGESMTGVVGTALYVAPELLVTTKRTLYSQKVDIYSLGIIFFEMMYTGLGTKMERAKVLSNLRLPTINFPDDFDEAKNERESNITRLCLNHDPIQRPSATDLLKSRWVPTVVLQEGEVLDAVSEMLSDPRSKTHKLLIDAVFDQADNPTTSVIYDIDMHLHSKRNFSASSSVVQHQAHDKVAAILRRHGATAVNIPLLVSRQGCGVDDSEAATFLDRSGTVVSLPHNLRVPFARFVTCGGHVSVKRYAIGKVFRARRVRGSKPKELWECSFDLVTPTPSGLVPDAEVVSAVAEIISHFPALTSRKYEIRINHLTALEAVLRHCGVESDQHDVALDALVGCDRLSKAQIEACLGSLPITQQQVSNLSTSVLTHGSLSKLQAVLKPLARNSRRSSVSLAGKKALQELESIQKHLTSLQVELPIVYDLGFIPKHHRHYNGIVFQVSAEIQKKKRTAIDILAVGGRYDKLLASMSHLRMTEVVNSPDGQTFHAIGVSIAIEKVVDSVLHHSGESSSSQGQGDPVLEHGYHHQQQPVVGRHPTVSVLVCAIGRSQLLQERLRIVRSLWDAGIATETPYERSPHSSVQDMQEVAQQNGIGHLVYITEKDSGKATIKSLTHSVNGKLAECKIPLEQLIEYLSKKINEVDDVSPRDSQPKAGSSAINSSVSESHSHSSSAQTQGGTRRLTVELIPPEKLAYNIRKRHEIEIRTKLSSLPLLSHVSNKTHVCAIAIELPSEVLRTMSISVDLRNGEEEFNSSAVVFSQSVPRHRKYLSTIAEKICEAKFSKEIPFILLYSYKDDDYVFLL